MSSKLIKEVKDMGFLNGRIKFGKNLYNIKLMTNEVYNEYIKMTEKKDETNEQYFKAFQYLCTKCLYRIEEVKPFWKRILKLFRFKVEYEKVHIYDFDIYNYPYVLTDLFIKDFFKVVIDKDFFQILMQSEVVE